MIAWLRELWAAVRLWFVGDDTDSGIHSDQAGLFK
jgi:hypothetical protein